MFVRSLKLVYTLMWFSCVLLSQLEVNAQRDTNPGAQVNDSTTVEPKKDRSILVKDTIKVNERYKLIHPVFDLEFYTKENLDTSVNDIHLYYPYEQDFRQWQQPGNLGQVPYDISLPKVEKLNLTLGIPQNNIYNFDRKNTPFYQNEAPYTFARYITGADQEQLFEVKHAQNFSPLISIALSYKHHGSEGAYRRQEAKLNNIGANAWLRTPNNKYNFLLSYLSNNQKRIQNGGITDSENLFDGSSRFRLNKDTYLGNAQSQSKQAELFIQQSYDIGETKDSLDTKDSVYVSWLVPTFRFIHRFSIETELRDYVDDAPPDDYYPNYFYPNNNITDSVRMRTYKNELLAAWEGRINDKDLGIKLVSGITLLNSRLGWATENTDTTQLRWDRKLNALLFKAKGFTSENFFTKNLKIFSELEYGLAGWNTNNIYWKTNANYQLLKDIQLNFSYELNVRKPDLVFYEYHSFNHDWDIDELKNISQNRISIGASYKNWVRLNYSIGQISNFTYFNSFQQPNQLRSSVALQEIELQTYLKYKHFLHWRNKIIFQQENTSAIAIPKLIVRSDVYYAGKIFKRALEVQAGISCNYMSSFNAFRFSPSLGNFYSNGSNITDQYPLLDLFINFKVKRATIFVRSFHLLQGVPGMEGMFAYPDYPLQDRAFKFGFSWGFYD